MKLHHATLTGYTMPCLEGVSTPIEMLIHHARVSSTANQFNHATGEKLFKSLIRRKEWSPLEQISLNFEVYTTRDVSQQMIRHKSLHFQELCIEGNQKVTTLTCLGKVKKVKISDLYKRYKSSYWGRSDQLVRVYDENSKTLIPAKIKEVFSTGKKHVYKMSLEGRSRHRVYSIICTKDHKLLTFEGFKRLGDIDIEKDFVATNGKPVYQNYEWLKNAKDFSILTKTGLQGIADLANTTTHTIRKWLRINGLQYSKKEVASYNPIWNKGLPSELQPRYGKYMPLETREKIREKSRKGYKNNLYKTGNYTKESLSWRRKVAQWCLGYKQELLIKQGYKCAISGKSIDITTAEVDHILPVYARPDLAFNIENLQVLSKEQHKIKTERESKDARLSIVYRKIKSIDYYGEVETYDLEVEHTSHNYVCEGIITHNSQRYADVSEQECEVRTARGKHETDRQKSVAIELSDPRVSEWYSKQREAYDKAKQAYEWALHNGIAKEVARSVLPIGITTKLYVAGTLRDFYHYCMVRCDEKTQLEHRKVAESIRENIYNLFPILREIDNECE